MAAGAQGPGLEKGDGGPNGTGAHDAKPQNDTPELDDFGLPIRKRPPPVLMTEGEDMEGNNPGEHADPPKSENGTAQEIILKDQQATSEQPKPQSSDNDSEGSEQEYKDAPSTPHGQNQLAQTTTEEEAKQQGKKVLIAQSDVSMPDGEKAESKDIRDQDITTSATTTNSNFPNGHKRGQSSQGQGISEWSHQQSAVQIVEETGKEDDDGGWQTMPSYAPYDIYDDDNKLIARERHESDEEPDAYAGLGGAGKGYTRVQLDEDAQSATSLDEDTKYLFKDSGGGTGAGEMEDEDPRDVVSQMQATKDLLTESQRIAYVGMTRLLVSAMVNEADSLYSKGSTKKELKMGAEAMRMWGQKMMVRLYAHMDINPAEQIMIEQLAEHGVVPHDLTPTLMQNARVKNPMADQRSSYTPSVNSNYRYSKSSLDMNGRFSSPVPEEDAAQPPPPYQDHEGDDLPEVRTPSQLPTTKNIDIDLRWTVLCDLFLTLIADSVYDARSRTLLEKVGANMGISWLEICRFEKRVTDALEMQQAAEKENWNEEEHKENRRKMALKRRYVMMGLATVGGGLVIGLSAGLLAPVIGAGLAAGFTTIGVAGTSGFLAGAGGAAIITSTAAASGGYIAIKAANRRTGAVKTFEYRPLHNNKRVNLIVTVSGWMTGKVDDVRLPYSTVDPIMGDIYSVLWEPEMLTSMGDTINILATEALTQGLQQLLGSTILVGLMAALQLPVVLTKLAYLIDNPWTVSLDRANAAGLILADSLIDRNLGTRPITFVGYSLGSRVIFSCLRELFRKGAFGLVQNVYLFGSPIVAKREEYLKAKSVVSGRFVNGYAKNDWILGYLFRLTSGGISRVAGLAPVNGVAGVENVDVTEFVPGHMAYRAAMPRLLREVGWIVESDEFTEIEDADPDNHAERQRELINEIEEARKEYERQEKEKEAKGKFGFFSRKKRSAVEKKEWETYDDAKAQPKKKTEDAEGNNYGVLFDVDAIRAELANERIDVKELQSTLPPMKLDMERTSPSSRSRDTRSLDANFGLQAKNHKHSFSTPSRPSIPEVPKSAPRSPYYYEEEEEVQMSFDYDEPHRQLKPSVSSADPYVGPKAAQPSPPLAEPTERSAAVERPELKSSTTEPTPLPSSMNLGHNAWADEYDDEDFGQEKEISMTFA